jgi:hypothetical protein
MYSTFQNYKDSIWSTFIANPEILLDEEVIELSGRVKQGELGKIST